METADQNQMAKITDFKQFGRTVYRQFFFIFPFYAFRFKSNFIQACTFFSLSLPNNARK